jgi:hypothetical protein
MKKKQKFAETSAYAFERWGVNKNVGLIQKNEEAMRKPSSGWMDLRVRQLTKSAG